jgi:uncharacterized protein YfaS (alpha-2-macroglobulin family)
MKKRVIGVGAALAAVASFALYATAQVLVKVEAFGPRGEVKSVRQVTARFSEAMVAFGDPRLPSPFDIQCAAKGSGHWVDARNWVYDFEADLPAGLKCSFTVKAGLKSAAGSALASESFGFSTGGPAVRASWPGDGDENIDELQHFVLALDAAADPASIREHASCSVAGIGEKIPLEVLEGSARDAILVEQQNQAHEVFSVLGKRGHTGLLTVKDSRLKDAPLVVARCARRLPPGAKLSLNWGAGIRTASGIATSANQTLAYKVRSDFEVRQSCTRVGPKAGCVPVLPIMLGFSAPVERALAQKIELRAKDGKVFTPAIAEKAKSVESLEFKGPFPARSELSLVLPSGFKDDAGRAPVNAASFPLKLSIDEDPPLIKFPSRFGILEANAQPLLPVSVRNVEATLRGRSATLPAVANTAGSGKLARLDASDDKALASWLDKILLPPHERNGNMIGSEGEARYPREGELPLLHQQKKLAATPLELPRASGDKTFELIGIPLPKPGLYVVEFASKRLGAALHGEKKPYYAYSSALVTNLAVHFKRGRESSLLWVTRLDNAQPVADAEVRITDCLGVRLWDGHTDSHGIAQTTVPLPSHWREECRHTENGYIVTARKDGDFSFMLTSWHNGIEPWQFNLAGGQVERPLIAHTVLDRPLFRAGETVSMKHFLRQPSGKGFTTPKPESLVQKIEISHEGSGQRYPVSVAWRNGAGVSSWAIPKEAKLGLYKIVLHGARGEIESGSFRVEQYRVPLMKAAIKPPAAPTVNSASLTVDAQLGYMAGGPAAGAPVKFRSRVVPYPLIFPGYDDFTFGGRLPKEGLEVQEPYGYDPDGEEEGNDAGEAGDAGVGYPVRTKSLSLDASGGARVVFDGLPRGGESRALEIEMEYADPNGQILTSANRALLLPSAVVLGMRLESHWATRERLAFKVLALSPQGKVLVGRKVVVEAYLRKSYAYRKRLLGGFYAYEETAEIKRVGTVCKGETDARGLLVCDGEAPEGGELVLVARAKDDGGNEAIARADTFIADSDAWFGAGASDRIDVLADKRSYEPGETARFEVRMPFREAMALVTVEREGVLDAKVVPISAKSPFVDVKILDSYGPNAYVSVMVIRGRVDPEMPGRFAWLKRMVYRIGMFFGLVKEMPREVDTRPTSLVDLTKPAFKLGMAQIRVGWQGYTLNVKVEPDKAAYRVRDRAAVKITVTTPDGRPASNAEVALAAVDEGLLALAAPTSWNLLEAMMERRPEEVETSTAQSQVIGKRHFGKKAAAPGGGGGAANARELFDTLLLWNPALKLDARGEARVVVPLNDSLTSFRIEAIAHAGDSRFGSGSARISSTQELMLFAGLPPFVREGDRFDAGVTVRNGGERPLTLDVGLNGSSGALPIPGGKQRVSLAVGEAKTLSFPTQVPFDARQIEWRIDANEVGGGRARDALKFTQTVGAAYPVRVYQQTLEQLELGKALSFPVQIPKGAIPGRGGIDVSLSSSLGGNFAAIRDWMSRYPYSCLEQRTSIAISTEDAAAWQRVANSMAAYLDRDGLARYFATDRLEGDDSLTAYLLRISQAAGREIPEAARERMLKALEDFVAGRVRRYGAIESADLAVRKMAAIDALAVFGRARPEMLQTLEIAPNLWPSSAVIDWISVLHRLPDVPEHDKRLAEARQILRSRLMFSGTTLNFSTEKQDYLWWLMVSPDLNAVRALAVLNDDPFFQADMPRLARGALARQVQGRWRTTLANAWGVVALRHFQARFEREAVGGNTALSLGKLQQKLDWAQARAADPGVSGSATGRELAAHLAWPAGAAPLSLSHEGGGKPWAIVTSRAALPLAKPLFAGYQIRRTVTAIDQKKSGVWSVGDVYRVKLDIDAQSDLTWVVVNDPVPAGSTVLGSGLGGDSAHLVAGEKRSGWAWPSFEERVFDGYRAYYAYLPKGRHSIEYSVRLNNAGRFLLPGSRIEAMYAPEIFGETPIPTMEIRAR